MEALLGILNWPFVINNAVSFALGFGASFLVWYVVQHKLVPAVEFSPELNKYELPNGEFIYRAAFQNTGRRDIIDVQVVVRIGIKGFLGASDWAYHSVKTNASQIPVLSPGKRRVVRLFDARDDIEFIDLPSKSLRDKILRCQSLPEIMSLGEDSTVQIHIFGFDRFSGSRRHFGSKSYRKTDIRLGRYKGLDVVENDKLDGYRQNSSDFESGASS